MTIKTPIFAAALLGLSAIALPGMSGSAHAAGIADAAAIPSDMLAVSAFGISVGTEAAFASALDAARGLRRDRHVEGHRTAKGPALLLRPSPSAWLLAGCEISPASASTPRRASDRL